MAGTLHKVTVFILRERAAGPELLLFRHPYAGVQLPAGTVEPGESFDAAALREAVEESGLPRESLRVVACLGERDDPLPPDRVPLLAAAVAYARPDPASFDWVRFRRGTVVTRLRQEAGYTQVSYMEHDREPDPQYVTYQITGWVADSALGDRQTRHFFEVAFTGETPALWQVDTDHHTFTPFWAAVGELPPLIPPQDRWLDLLPDRFEKRHDHDSPSC